MDIHKFISVWLIAGNAFDNKIYFKFYHPDAILEDPSLGRKFTGHEGIKDYFESYFIGYNTNTELVNLNIKGEENIYLEVEFTGDFSEGKLGGIFDLKLKDNTIIFAKADLIY